MRGTRTLVLLGAGTLLLTLFLTLVAAPARAALPTQFFRLPLPLAPEPGSARLPASASFFEIEFPDARRGQIVRLDAWFPVGSMHAVRVAVDYVGLESEDTFRYGGGPLEVQYSAGYDEPWPLPTGIDLALVVPVGDASLHPLSAKPTALRGRVRSRVVAAEGLQVWTGFYADLVSPPTNSVREAPRDGFPSGSGLDLAMRGRFGGWVVDAVGRHPLFGAAARETTIHIGVERSVSPSLAVRAVGVTSIGPSRARLVDHAWGVSLVWRPEVRRVGADPDDRR